RVMPCNGVHVKKQADLDRTSVLEALHGLATALADTTSPGAVAALVAGAARALLRADDVVIHLCDRDAHVLRLAHVEHGEPGLHARPVIADGWGAVGQAVQTGGHRSATAGAGRTLQARRRDDAPARDAAAGRLKQSSSVVGCD